MSDEIFDSAVRSAGDFAGVFEDDGETAFFYLYDLKKSEGKRICDAIRIFKGVRDIVEADIAIRWDGNEDKVGLFIREVLVALYDIPGKARYGGGCESEEQAALPSEAVTWFQLRNPKELN